MRTTSWARISMATTVLLALGACSSSTPVASDSPPPRSLNGIEAASEDVIDQVPRERWTRIDAGVSTMQRSWRRYRREATVVDARQARRLDGALRRLATSASRRDGFGTQQAANDVSAPVVELLDHYALGHPVQVGRLDVIGRQVVLDVGLGRFDAAARSVRSAREQWLVIRASAGHRGPRVAARVDHVLARLRTEVSARDATASKNDANDLLELVDALERLY
jgi:hypothetical protein